MNPEPDIDPYAPPASDPTLPPLSPADSGSLWRVVGGRLQVRKSASLPDVCIDGSPDHEPGQRYPLEFSTLLPGISTATWCVFLAILFSYNLKPMFLFLGCGIVMVLPWLFEKKVRVLAFRSRRSAGRSRLLEILLLAGFVGFAFAAMNFPRDPAGSYFYLLPFGVLAVLAILSHFIPGRTPSRAKALPGDWFELKGIAPAAITRFEELQQRLASRKMAGSFARN
ncbi:hypothetical protein [Luteolibacter sp. Populi]|uniref:hypothetical protein n=1 Tax=Luteolibacter sp. Populi TaxID=3230487 RepID=UPI003467C01B